MPLPGVTPAPESEPTPSQLPQQSNVAGTAPASSSSSGLPLSVHGLRSSDAKGYFDLPRDAAHSSGAMSIRSNESLPNRNGSHATAAALTALQYLPMPLVVLSGQKTVILANDAFARLLGIELPVLADDGETLLSITDLVSGKGISELGVDLLQHGSPTWVSWEVRLGDSLRMVSFELIHLM